MARVAGADGCRAGWIWIARDSATQTVDAEIVSDATSLANFTASLAVLALDIPVGLPDKGGRQCDDCARRCLGSPRRNSVIPVPIRSALGAATREEASEITEQADGRRVSTQAWAIYRKIRDVDNVLSNNPDLQKSIREVHPEVSFWAWNGERAMANS